MNLKPRTSLFLYCAVAAVAVGGTAVIAMNVRAGSVASLAPQGKPALTVSVEQPRRMDLASRLAANGSVAAWQEASIGSEANGLRLAAVHANVGDKVRRGQVLASFAAETVQAELAQINANVAEAQAQAAEAAANGERARSLAASGALSAQQINQFVTAEQTAQARLEAHRAAARVQQLRLAQAQVLAPDDGVISARLATPGAVVPAGQELFRLIRMNRLEWRAEVTTDELGRIAPGAAAVLKAPGGGEITGRVRTVAPTVDARTRTALVYVDLPQGAVKAGMFAQGEFDMGRSSALTVPQQALVVRDGFSYLFRLEGADRVAQVKVRTGRRLGDRVEVLDGITPETRLVSGGAGFLNDNDLVKVVKP